MSTPDVYEQKYNPPNYTPEHLFRPPTSPLKREFQYLIRELTGALEARGKNILRVGTELEIFFFSPEADPYTARNSEKNPNYAIDHKLKILELWDFFNEMQKNKPSKFLDFGHLGRIFFEIRTQPQNVREHVQTIQSLGKDLRKKCAALNVLPVVHSQHLHVSLLGKHATKPSLSKPTIGSDSILPEYSRVIEAFSRVNPLVLLPEEWADRYHAPYDLNFSGKRSKDDDDGDLTHPEFRRLSSEYAHDPTLNLLISLFAMHSGCHEKKSESPVNTVVTYKEAVRDMEQDPELISFFGQSTLSTLASIIRQYPVVSCRGITVDQIKGAR